MNKAKQQWSKRETIWKKFGWQDVIWKFSFYSENKSQNVCLLTPSFCPNYWSSWHLMDDKYSVGYSEIFRCCRQWTFEKFKVPSININWLLGHLMNWLEIEHFLSTGLLSTIQIQCVQISTRFTVDIIEICLRSLATAIFP